MATAVMHEAKFGDEVNMYSPADFENSEDRQEGGRDRSFTRERATALLRRNDQNVCGNYTSFVKRDGIIPRVHAPGATRDFNSSCLKKYRYAVFELNHCNATGAHSSRKKTWKRIAEKFYWPGMGHDFEQMVHSCEVCQHTNDSDIELYEPHEYNEEQMGCV
ncbi:hypothetical protein GWK47_049007 [Chionoecetes opilio]|uniref:Integrase zinc-binding domain-containing protein n=1 Tax=Chionoecetes opilio TaxID=41210 RepID=A0A8J4YF35_CHIOP|nr:hypothetical protein GWK47_049007 [Chionoecetes opilio]